MGLGGELKCRKQSRRERYLEEMNDHAVDSIIKDSSLIPLVLGRSMVSLLSMIVFLFYMF